MFKNPNLPSRVFAGVGQPPDPWSVYVGVGSSVYDVTYMGVQSDAECRKKCTSFVGTVCT